jgi:hypothetical protein
MEHLVLVCVGFVIGISSGVVVTCLCRVSRNQEIPRPGTYGSSRQQKTYAPGHANASQGLHSH